MNSAFKHDVRGFSLMEVLIAIMITMIVMASVFALLQKGQDSFRREPQVADMNANARSGLARISQDLTYAGYETPPNMSIMWFDGGGLTPDELTIVYADVNVPTSKPITGAPSATIGQSSTLLIDTTTFSAEPADFTQVYHSGQVLMAIQGPNGVDPACDALAPGIVPFELTQDPTCTSAGSGGGGGKGGGGGGGGGCDTLQLNHNPSGGMNINVPNGFDNQVNQNCATVGYFHVVQYRVNPLPPTPNPMLERRDLALVAPNNQWIPVASNIENFQVQFAQGVNNVFNDVPPLIPMGNDLNSWITQVQVTVAGRSESTNLQGGTQGVFAADDTHLRRTFSTVVSLRNQLGQAAIKAIEDGIPMAWN